MSCFARPATQAKIRPAHVIFVLQALRQIAFLDCDIGLRPEDPNPLASIMNLNRFIKLVLVTLSFQTAAGLWAQEAGHAPTGASQLGWQLAIHAYTFRKFSIFECIDKTAALGLNYMSLSGSVNLGGTNTPTTVQLPAADSAAIQKATAAKGIKLVNIGVVKLPPNETESRKVFEFAKRMGIDTLVAEPEPAALDLVERLCKEYNLKVAIHNHPKPSYYWNPETVRQAVQGRTPLMGACADTGHWLRSGLDPVECLRKLDGRVICLHFKDLVPEEERSQSNARRPLGHRRGERQSPIGRTQTPALSRRLLRRIRISLGQLQPRDCRVREVL